MHIAEGLTFIISWRRHMYTQSTACSAAVLTRTCLRALRPRPVLPVMVTHICTLQPILLPCTRSGGPSRLVSQPSEAVWELLPGELAQAGWSLEGALMQLAAELGATFPTAMPQTATAATAGVAVHHCGGQGAAPARVVTPLVNCGGVFAPPRRPPLPPPGSRLTAAGLCAVVAAMQPEGCVVVDESLTTGSTYWEASQVGW